MRVEAVWQVLVTMGGVVLGVGGQDLHDPSLDLSNTSSSSDSDNSSNSSGWAPPHPPPSPATPMSCEEARIKCALRKGCGRALEYYMLGCADLMAGRSTQCDEYCRNSLIALTSTQEGYALMNCVCSDDYCRETKERVEVCREEVVLGNAASTVVSCSLAHWICAANTLCSTAIYYYDLYCRKMFVGKGCSYRCNNSISILQRQTAAAKLETCECDGSETFDCAGIKRNMARLCFHQVDEEELQREEEQTNQVETRAISKASLSSASNLQAGQNTPLLVLTTFLLHLLVSAVVRWRTSSV